MLDAKREASGRRAVHLDVGGFRVREQFFNRGFVVSVCNAFRSDQFAAVCVCFESPRAVSQFLRKCVAVVALTVVGMDLDGPGLWERFDTRESIVGEKDSPILSRYKCFQAVPARGRVPGDFHVGRKSVRRRLQSRSHRVRHFGGHRYNSHRRIHFCSPVETRRLQQRRNCILR
jgi:hypothetical protein